MAAWSTLFGFIVLLPWAGLEMWEAPVRITLQALDALAYLGIAVTVAGLF